MNFLAHLAYFIVLDWLFFQYLYTFANRYTVLNFGESAFLPARYIMSGLVVGAFLYWLYLVPISFLKRYVLSYWHPRWWLLWLGVAIISSIQIVSIVRRSDPALSIGVTTALLVHLQLMHFMTVMVANRIATKEDRSILPGVRPAILFIGMWLFWVGYSFTDNAQGDPAPTIGSTTERTALAALLATLLVSVMFYRFRWDSGIIPRDRIIVPLFDIAVSDLLDSFWAAWGLYYLLVPIVHYMVRGYIISHSSLFPSFLLGIIAPMGWSLIVMWGILLISKPQFRPIQTMAQQWRTN